MMGPIENMQIILFNRSWLLLFQKITLISIVDLNILLSLVIEDILGKAI